MTRYRDHLPLIALLGLALVLTAGCGGDDDAPTPPPVFIDQAFADDIAQHFANVLATDHGGTVLSLAAPAATIPSSVANLLARGARPAGLGALTSDTTFTVGGITWVVVDTFYTAGVPDTDYSPASDRVSVRSFGSGSLVIAGAGGLFRHRGHLTATGLSPLQDTLRFDGIGRDSTKSWFTGKFSGATRRMLCVADIVWEQVTLLRGQAPDTPPLDGFATCTVNARRLGATDTLQTERQAQVVVLLAFDGSSTLTMNVGTLYEYTVNLRTGALNRLVARPS